MCLVTMTTSELVENNSPSSGDIKHYSSDSDWTVAQVGGASHSAADVSTQLTGGWRDCFHLFSATREPWSRDSRSPALPL